MHRRIQALGRLKTGEMNKTEAEYDKYLMLLMRAGEVAWYRFESMTFKLAFDTRYTPDFIVMLANGQLEAHEVKGSKRIFEDDAKVKVKVAAEMFPLKFKVVFPIKGSGFSGWEVVDNFSQ